MIHSLIHSSTCPSCLSALECLLLISTTLLGTTEFLFLTICVFLLFVPIFFFFYFVVTSCFPLCRFLFIKGDQHDFKGIGKCLVILNDGIEFVWSNLGLVGSQNVILIDLFQSDQFTFGFGNDLDRWIGIIHVFNAQILQCWFLGTQGGIGNDKGHVVAQIKGMWIGFHKTKVPQHFGSSPIGLTTIAVDTFLAVGTIVIGKE
mmetsp:Transcript_12299/g.29279  ORF Transcript_12299/g.29279 Transcript_12299/m.29279 type:complete len:203 (+) Transcript_12299:263-871(+)